MKRLTLLILISYFILTNAVAQNPSWAKKAAQAVFTLKTFNADGGLIGSTNGFFISEKGEAVSSFTPWKGAQRAVVIDADGKEWPVSCIIGANDMYDVAKFQVAVKKATALPIGTAASGAAVWLLPYAVKKSPTCISGTVSQSERFQESYDYYTLQLRASEQQASSPVMNERGEAIGLLQPSADGQSTTCYAVSTRFAADMQFNGLSMSDPALRTTGIAKAIPENYDQAVLALFMGATVMSAEQYADYIDRFIQQYPNAADGYIYRARQASAQGRFDSADQDMKKAVSVSDKKDDTHYQFAQLIYQKELYQQDQPYDGWNLQKALDESKAAYGIQPLPIYRQQQAQILYAQQNYAEAYTAYEDLSRTELRSADNFYAAAQCKLQTDDKRAAMLLIDSAVNMFSRPYVKTAAPYLRARAQLSMEIRRYQQAINDMEDVVTLEPNDAELWAEKASYELRVNLFDKALESAQECLRLAPGESDGYLMSGIAQCAKGDKAEGLQNLNKAKELGNSQAQTFIDKYSK